MPPHLPQPTRQTRLARSAPLSRGRCPRLVWLLVTACILYTPLFAATVPLPDPSRLPQLTKPIAHVLVPIPSETFASLDQYRDSNWSAVQRPCWHKRLPTATPLGSHLSLER